MQKDHDQEDLTQRIDGTAKDPMTDAINTKLDDMAADELEDAAAAVTEALNLAAEVQEHGGIHTACGSDDLVTALGYVACRGCGASALDTDEVIIGRYQDGEWEAMHEQAVHNSEVAYR